MTIPIYATARALLVGTLEIPLSGKVTLQSTEILAQNRMPAWYHLAFQYALQKGRITDTDKEKIQYVLRGDHFSFSRINTTQELACVSTNEVPPPTQTLSLIIKDEDGRPHRSQIEEVVSRLHAASLEWIIAEFILGGGPRLRQMYVKGVDLYTDGRYQIIINPAPSA